MTRRSSCRLAEVAGGLSLAGDLADGFPEGKAIRTAALAAELALELGASDEERRSAFFLTLMRFLGCTGFAAEESSRYGAGDDISVRRAMALADASQPLRSFAFAAREVGRGARLVERARALRGLFGDARAVAAHANASCDTSLSVARVFELDVERLGVAAIWERWDGRGVPAQLRGEGIPLPARLLQVADVLETSWHRYGWDAALVELKRRRGKQLDPELVRIAVRAKKALCERLERRCDWEWFLECEPEPHVIVPAHRLNAVAACLGRLVDVKSFFTLGHSANVASLAARVAASLGATNDELASIEMAAHLHDLGRMGISNALWDKPGIFSRLEREHVERHTLDTDRILRRTPAFADLAPLASAAHERLDGSGYHRRVPPSALERGARILAVADVAAALGERRPHRPPRTTSEIASTLRGTECRGLDPMLVEATLAVLTGDRRDGRRASGAWPAGLTDREIEVLRWVAIGKTNAEVGSILAISARTVQNHLANAYDKIGVSSRGGAALFMMEHGLLLDAAR